MTNLLLAILILVFTLIMFVLACFLTVEKYNEWQIEQSNRAELKQDVDSKTLL